MLSHFLPENSPIDPTPPKKEKKKKKNGTNEFIYRPYMFAGISLLQHLTHPLQPLLNQLLNCESTLEL